MSLPRVKKNKSESKWICTKKWGFFDKKEPAHKDFILMRAKQYDPWRMPIAEELLDYYIITCGEAHWNDIDYIITMYKDSRKNRGDCIEKRKNKFNLEIETIFHMCNCRDSFAEKAIRYVIEECKPTENEILFMIEILFRTLVPSLFAEQYDTENIFFYSPEDIELMLDEEQAKDKMWGNFKYLQHTGYGEYEFYFKELKTLFYLIMRSELSLDKICKCGINSKTKINELETCYFDDEYIDYSKHRVWKDMRKYLEENWIIVKKWVNVEALRISAIKDKPKKSHKPLLFDNELWKEWNMWNNTKSRNLSQLSHRCRLMERIHYLTLRECKGKLENWEKKYGRYVIKKE